MNQRQTTDQGYLCPMHADVRQLNPGKCPKCGMALVQEGARFRMLRHMMSSPWHLLIMILVMALAMAIVMMMMR